MAKAKKTKGEQERTVAYYALVRAAEQAKSQGIGELDPGSYPFDLSATLSGELLVEAGSEPGEPKTVADVSDSDVLAGLIGSLPEEERATVISAALGVVKASKPADLKALKADAASVILAASKRRKMTKETQSPGRKGAVKGKPKLVLGGRAGQNTVELEVAAA